MKRRIEAPGVVSVRSVDGAQAMVKTTAGRSAALTQSRRFDAFRLANRGEALAGEIDVAQRERVLDRQQWRRWFRGGSMVAATHSTGRC